MSNVPIIILHGWGLKGSIYKNLINLFKQEGFKVFAPDLPGFGVEVLYSSSMNLDGYVEFLDGFIKKNKISKPILIGHSFGGRIAIKYTYKNPQKVSKLILTGVPIVRNKSFTKKIAFVFAVVGGKLLSGLPTQIREVFRKNLYRVIGEWDYYKAGRLRQVFKNIIGEDLIQYLKEIKTPVLLVWGREDRIVPVSDIYKIKKYLLKAKFIIVPNTGHKLPYENPDVFLDAIESFL